MAALWNERFMRAASEMPGGYDSLRRGMLRARSVLPESMYEDAYNRSQSRAFSRAASSIRESSSTFRREVVEDIPAPVVHTITKVREVEERPRRNYLSSYLDYFRRGDALVHAKITIRKRDNYWKDKYIQDIVNANPVYVVRPRYIVQRPVYVYQPPPQPRTIVVPQYIYRAPRTFETVRTVSRYSRYIPPTRTYLTHQTLGSSSESSNYSSSSSSSANYLRNYSSNNYLTY